MTQPLSVEGVIEVASRLKESVAGLHDAYGLFPAIIDKEHRAVRGFDLPQLEEAREAKELAGDKVETCFTAMMKAGEQLGALRARYTDKVAVRPVTLTEMVQALRDIAAAVPGEALGVEVLTHLTAALATLVDSVLERHRTVKPQIEANRHLVGAMLRNVQESYRFWVEIREQLALGYNSQGVQKAQGRNSGFRIKA